MDSSAATWRMIADLAPAASLSGGRRVATARVLHSPAAPSDEACKAQKHRDNRPPHASPLVVPSRPDTAAGDGRGGGSGIRLPMGFAAVSVCGLALGGRARFAASGEWICGYSHVGAGRGA
jgi:hypothetical protein